MSTEDRERLHQLLDFAIDNGEDYVLYEFARMSLDWQLMRRTYKLHFKIYDDR